MQRGFLWKIRIIFILILLKHKIELFSIARVPSERVMFLLGQNETSLENIDADLKTRRTLARLVN